RIRRQRARVLHEAVRQECSSGRIQGRLRWLRRGALRTGRAIRFPSGERTTGTAEDVAARASAWALGRARLSARVFLVEARRVGRCHAEPALSEARAPVAEGPRVAEDRRDISTASPTPLARISARPTSRGRLPGLIAGARRFVLPIHAHERRNSTAPRRKPLPRSLLNMRTARSQTRAPPGPAAIVGAALLIAAQSVRAALEQRRPSDYESLATRRPITP